MSITNTEQQMISRGDLLKKDIEIYLRKVRGEKQSSVEREKHISNLIFTLEYITSKLDSGDHIEAGVFLHTLQITQKCGWDYCLVPKENQTLEELMEELDTYLGDGWTNYAIDYDLTDMGNNHLVLSEFYVVQKLQKMLKDGLHEDVCKILHTFNGVLKFGWGDAPCIKCGYYY